MYINKEFNYISDYYYVTTVTVERIVDSGKMRTELDTDIGDEIPEKFAGYSVLDKEKYDNIRK
jgi:hypothetical protein